MLGVFVLIYGLFAKSYHTQMAAYLVLVIASAGAIFAYTSGNDLGYTMSNMQGISQYNITRHTNFANYSMIALFFLGIMSLLALWLNLKESLLVKMITPVVVFTALISFIFVARTGFLGAQIRHFEVRNKTLPEIPAAVNKVTVTSFPANDK
jgi:uncharacterized membrane protein